MVRNPTKREPDVKLRAEKISGLAFPVSRWLRKPLCRSRTIRRIEMERINIGVVGDFPSGLVISIIQAYNLGDIKPAQQSVQQSDGACTCANIERPMVDKTGICFSCHQPRR